MTVQDGAGPLREIAATLNEILRELLFLPDQAEAGAASLDALQYFQFVTFALLGFIVFTFTAVFLVRHVRRPAAMTPGHTRRVEAPLWLELGIAGALLGMFVLWWVLGFGQYTKRLDAPADASLVYVTARQWVWRFEYSGGRVSTGVLYVPADRDIRLLLSSRDVIHSFFVPAFRLKMDAVPGRWTSTWFRATEAGRHRIFCAEYCGAGHSRMWGEVVVLPEADYERWLEGGLPDVAQGTIGEPDVIAPDRGNTAEPRSMAERGIRIAAERGCLQCHSVDGSPHIGPTWRGLFGSRVPLESGDTVTANPAYLTESMMDPEVRIVRGFAPVMPSYHGLLTPADVGALIEYIRALRDESGDGDGG